MKLIFGHDQEVARWAQDKYQAGLAPFICALGIVDEQGMLRGAVTFHDFNGSNVEFCYWGPATLRLGIACQMAHFCFEGLKVQRVTVRTPRYNKDVRSALPKLGFQREGVLRRYYGPYRRHDAFIYGMTAEDASRLLRRATCP